MADKSRIMREVMNFIKDQSIVGMSLVPDVKDIGHLTATIPGPVSSPYEGGIFHVDITLPDGYPFVPPKMRFTTKVWHPNISSQTGAICLDILKNNWSPALNLKTTMLSLQALLSTPEPNDPQDAVVAKQYLSDHATYVATARSWTEDFAKASSDGFKMKVQKLVEMGFPEALVNKTLEAVGGELRMMAFEQEELWENASERITWHEKLEGEQAIQNRVHELVSVGNLNAAVNLLLSTPPESSYLYPNALRAVALSSAISTSLNELAVKVVASNMVRTDRSLSGTHLLCAVGRYQEACSQLQDAGCWTDAATLASTHLKGTDYARVMHRWAGHVLNAEHNIWRKLTNGTGIRKGEIKSFRGTNPDN